MEVHLKSTDELKGSFIEIGRAINDFFGVGASESLEVAKEVTMVKDGEKRGKSLLTMKDGVDLSELKTAFQKFGIEVSLQQEEETKKS